MTSVYAKGTRVWLPDTTAGWVPGTVTSVVLPRDGEPSSEVAITVSVDGSDNTVKDYKCSLADLQAASDSNGNSLPASSQSPGQDALPPLRNPPLLESSEDLASLSNLNEPSGESQFFAAEWTSDPVIVLHAIATRYEAHQPYTYSGIVLVSRGNVPTCCRTSAHRVHRSR